MIAMFYRAAVAVAALGMIGVAAAVAAEPEPVDLGSRTQRAGDQAISVTIALKLADPDGAEAMMRQVSTPGDPRYLQFLTPNNSRRNSARAMRLSPASLHNSMAAASASREPRPRH